MIRSKLEKKERLVFVHLSVAVSAGWQFFGHKINWSE